MATKVNGWKGVPYALPAQAPVAPASPRPTSGWMGVPYALPENGGPTQEAVSEASDMGDPAQALQNNFNALKAKGFHPTGPINKTDNKLTDQEALKNLNVENTYLSPEDYNKLVQAAALTDPVKERKKQLTDLDTFNRDTISAIPVQTDLSPLMALADQWSGSKLAQSYHKPSGPEDRAKLLMDYGAKTEANKQKVMDEVLKAAQYMKSGTATNQLTSMLTGTQAAGYAPPKPPGGGSGARMDWQIAQEGNKVSKEFQESKGRLDSLSTALASGNLGDVTRALSLAARELSSEKGVLTDQDIGRVLPQTIGMSADKFASWITNNPNVKLDPKILQGLRDELPRALGRLQSRQAAKLAVLQDSMRASPELAGKTHILDAPKNSFTATPVKTEPTLKDMFHEFLQKK